MGLGRMAALGLDKDRDEKKKKHNIKNNKTDSLI